MFINCRRLGIKLINHCLLRNKTVITLGEWNNNNMSQFNPGGLSENNKSSNILDILQMIVKLLANC